MAYVQRNQRREIVAVFDSQQADAEEFISLDDPQLIAFLTKSANLSDVHAAFSASDIALIRVLDDLINTLISHKVIMFTDLPAAAREKLANREKIRGHLNNLENLMDDDDEILL